MAVLALPTARFQHYADPAGSSSGPGGSSSPWATVDQAIAAVPTTCAAVGGQTGTIHLSGTTASPNTFVSTAGITVRGTLTIQADQPLGAKLAGNGTSESILMALGANLSLKDIFLDPSLNNGGAAAACITIPSTATAISLSCTRVTFQNWTDHAVNSPVGSRCSVSLTDCWGLADLCNGYLYMNSTDSYPITVSGGGITLLRQTYAGRGGIIVFNHPPSAPTVRITNWSPTITLDPALTLGGPHYGIRIVDVPGATIVDGGTHQILGNPGSRTGYNIRIEFGAADISGSKITNATIYCSANGGIGAGIGTDGQVARQGSGCELSYLNVSAGPAARNAGYHCVFFGCVSDSTAHHFTVVDGGIGFVDKGTLRTQAHDFTITGCASSLIRSKGSVDAHYWDFTGTQTAGYTGYMMEASEDLFGPVYTTGLSYTGHWIINGATAGVFLSQGVGNSSTPLNNVYDLTGGSQNSSAWRWNTGATFGNLSGWKTIEPSASGTAL